MINFYLLWTFQEAVAETLDLWFSFANWGRLEALSAAIQLLFVREHGTLSTEDNVSVMAEEVAFQLGVYLAWVLVNLF